MNAHTPDIAPANLDLFGNALLAMKPAGVRRIDIGHTDHDSIAPWFSVTLYWDNTCVTEHGATLTEALAKADVSRLRKIAAANAQADIAAAEIASWGADIVPLAAAVREVAA